MGIEERISLLEEENKRLQKAIDYLKSRADDGFFTPEEVAEKMKCSRNHIYDLIREGIIETAPRIGKSIRIPMSQFYRNEQPVSISEEKPMRKRSGKEDIKKMIFG
ncbi:helix-turn-helix domain-containing protein [Robinsoniella sp.]|uniref:helix-turn-helix domain-containing protein n=1 Tax=Robinsoniella sp. TaxID=2496533 RepID=UPI003750EE91